MSPELYAARITFTRLGVGVNGGGFLSAGADAFLRFFKGVTGISGTLKSGAALSALLWFTTDFLLSLAAESDLGFLVFVSPTREDAARFL